MHCIKALIHISCLCLASAEFNKKNVVFILADDMGWNDVSFHGSNQIITPNIDVLAYSGVALHRYYTHPACTPSRTATLTGKYAHRSGMQGYPLTLGESRGIPLTEKLLPQYFKDLGYATHLVGKWHVGHYQYAYLPTFRGFDTHFGQRGGGIDYYEYVNSETWTIGKVSGLDLYNNVTADWSTEGYITDIYNKKAVEVIQTHDTSKPLFLMVGHSAPHCGEDGSLLSAPPEEVRKLRYIELLERRIYGAMVKKLDDSIGDIVVALSQKGILNDTVVVFVSDNGGPTTGLTENWSSNAPLRGIKLSPWEGGVRVVGLIWSSDLLKSKNLWDGYMHSADWLPTLMGAVGVNAPTDIDGFDLWNNIMLGESSGRQKIHEYDDYTGFETIIDGDYKLIVGNKTLPNNEYYGQDLDGIIGDTPSYLEELQKSKILDVFKNAGISFDLTSLNMRQEAKLDCGNKVLVPCEAEAETICLYNISEDPCEREDIKNMYPTKIQEMLASLNDRGSIIPRTAIYRDPRALPALFNYTWTSWNEPSLQNV